MNIPNLEICQHNIIKRVCAACATDDYARGNPWATPDGAEYADAEAARQDATAPHEAPQCVADRAAERRVIAGKLMTARWMMQEVERLLQREQAFDTANRALSPF